MNSENVILAFRLERNHGTVIYVEFLIIHEDFLAYSFC